MPIGTGYMHAPAKLCHQLHFDDRSSCLIFESSSFWSVSTQTWDIDIYLCFGKGVAFGEEAAFINADGARFG